MFAYGARTGSEQKIKFFVKLLYKKVCGFQRQRLWSPSAEGETLYRSGAHWESSRTFLQEKRFSKANYSHKLSSKIIRWMIFDGTSLNLVLADLALC